MHPVPPQMIVSSQKAAMLLCASNHASNSNNTFTATLSHFICLVEEDLSKGAKEPKTPKQWRTVINCHHCGSGSDQPHNETDASDMPHICRLARVLFLIKNTTG